MKYESPNITLNQKATSVVFGSNGENKSGHCAYDSNSEYTTGAYEVDE